MIYTTPSTPSQLPSLIHSNLGIHDILKKNPLKHNVIDRDKIVIPPNWDSWGKIRVLRDGWEAELVSIGWTIDLNQPLTRPRGHDATEGADGEHVNGGHEDEEPVEPEGSTALMYEAAVQDPTMDALQIAGRNTHTTQLEVETAETQEFLAQQLKILEAYKQKGDEGRADDPRNKLLKKIEDDDRYRDYYGRVPEPKVLEHIGPVQFNMGGIQVDADDMVQRLKVSGRIPPPSSPFFFKKKLPTNCVADIQPTAQRSGKRTARPLSRIVQSTTVVSRSRRR